MFSFGVIKNTLGVIQNTLGVLSNKEGLLTNTGVHFRSVPLLPSRVAEHTFKAKILINLRPMDTKTGEIKVLSLLFCCIRQTRPIRESITGSDTIIRLSINVRLVNPYFCNLQLLHTILFLKITFPALNNNLCVLFYNSFNNCDLLFLDTESPVSFCKVNLFFLSLQILGCKNKNPARNNPSEVDIEREKPHTVCSPCVLRST